MLPPSLPPRPRRHDRSLHVKTSGSPSLTPLPLCTPRIAAEPSPEERFGGAGALREPPQAGVFDAGGGAPPVLDNDALRERFNANPNTGASQADPDAQASWNNA